MKDMLPNTTFSDLINERINEGIYNPNRTIVNALTEKNIPTTMRSIQFYRNGTRVPSFLVAKEILNILSIDLSDEEIINILKSSRKAVNQKVDNKNYSSYYRDGREPEQSRKRTFVFNASEIDIYGTDEVKDQLLDNRLYELYESEDELEKYIYALIKKDLEEGVL